MTAVADPYVGDVVEIDRCPQGASVIKSGEHDVKCFPHMIGTCVAAAMKNGIVVSAVDEGQNIRIKCLITLKFLKIISSVLLYASAFSMLLCSNNARSKYF